MGQIRGKKRIELIRQVGARCCACRENHVSLEIHHIIPQELGGSDEMDNLIVLCPSCHALYHKTNLNSSTLLQIKSLAIKTTSKISNEISYRYYWFQTARETNRFLENDCREIVKEIRDKCLIKNNSILRELRKIESIFEELRYHKQFKDVEEFKSSIFNTFFLEDKFPGLTGEEKENGIHFYSYSLPVLANSDLLSHFGLSQNAVEFLKTLNETLLGHLTVSTDACGGDMRPTVDFYPQEIGTLILIIDNLTGIELKNLYFEERTLSNTGISNYYETLKQTKSYELEKASIRHLKTGESVAIPLAITWGKSIKEGKEINFRNSMGDIYLSNNEVQKTDNLFVVGSLLDIRLMRYTTNNDVCNLIFDEFDIKNTFSISQRICCGCCPYIYGEINGSAYPLGKILVNAITKMTSQSSLYLDYDKIWIEEREAEESYILDDGQFETNKIKKNGYFHLKFGDRLFFKKSKKIIKVTGFYKPY